MRKPLTVRILSSLDSKSWLALGVFLAFALIAVPVHASGRPAGERPSTSPPTSSR